MVRRHDNVLVLLDRAAAGEEIVITLQVDGSGLVKGTATHSKSQKTVEIQVKYNQEHGIVPASIVKAVRDLTDSMYNPKAWPYVDHYRGTALFIEHVEKYIAPTITSDQILGGKPFVFSGDPARK